MEERIKLKDTPLQVNTTGRIDSLTSLITTGQKLISSAYNTSTSSSNIIDCLATGANLFDDDWGCDAAMKPNPGTDGDIARKTS